MNEDELINSIFKTIGIVLILISATIASCNVAYYNKAENLLEKGISGNDVRCGLTSEGSRESCRLAREEKRENK